MSENNLLDSQKMALVAYEALDSKIGQDIKIIDIHEISVLADYFIIAHGNNKNQIQTLIDEVEKKVFELGFEPVNTEGSNSNWVLQDYGNIIVHVFHKDDRLFYDLERIWSDGKLMDIDELREKVPVI